MIIMAFLVGGGSNLVHRFIRAIPDGSGTGVSNVRLAGDARA